MKYLILFLFGFVLSSCIPYSYKPIDESSHVYLENGKRTYKRNIIDNEGTFLPTVSVTIIDSSEKPNDPRYVKQRMEQHKKNGKPVKYKYEENIVEKRDPRDARVGKQRYAK